MKIPFAKIGTAPRNVEVTEAAVTLEGSLKRTASHDVDFTGRIRGQETLICDRCGQPYTHTYDEAMHLHLTDGVARDKEDLDIIEFFDGAIDMASILHGEMDAVKGDYHYCPSCRESDTLLDIEL